MRRRVVVLLWNKDDDDDDDDISARADEEGVGEAVRATSYRHTHAYLHTAHATPLFFQTREYMNRKITQLRTTIFTSSSHQFSNNTYTTFIRKLRSLDPPEGNVAVFCGWCMALTCLQYLCRPGPRVPTTKVGWWHVRDCVLPLGPWNCSSQQTLRAMKHETFEWNECICLRRDK